MISPRSEQPYFLLDERETRGRNRRSRFSFRLDHDRSVREMSAPKKRHVFCWALRGQHFGLYRILRSFLTVKSGLSMSRHLAGIRPAAGGTNEGFRARIPGTSRSPGNRYFAGAAAVHADVRRGCDSAYMLLSRWRATTAAYNAFSSQRAGLRNVCSKLSLEREISRYFIFTVFFPVFSSSSLGDSRLCRALYVTLRSSVS